MAREVHHVVILQCADLLRSGSLRIFAEMMRVSAGLVAEIACHIGERRMIRHTSVDSFVEHRGCDGQRASLRASLRKEIFSVPFRKRCQQIEESSASEIDVLHIIFIRVIEAEFKIIALDLALGGKLSLAQFRMQTVDFDFQSDHPTFSVVAVGHRVFDCLHSGSRRSQHGRIFASPFGMKR